MFVEKSTQSCNSSLMMITQAFELSISLFSSSLPACVSISTMFSRIVSCLLLAASISSAKVLPNNLNLSCSCLERVSCFSSEKFEQAIDESVKIVLKGCDNVYTHDAVRELRLSFVRGGFTRSLSDFKNLDDLKISHSRLNNLSTNFLFGLKSLSRLSLDGNEIEKLQEFESLEKLEKLFLNNNKIKIVGNETFTNLQSLTLLTLEHNDIFRIHRNSFAENGKLLELNLNRNNLKVLDVQTFECNLDLQELSINHNQLTDLPDGIFSKNFKLEILRLHDNKLRSLRKKLLIGSRNLRWIELGANELQFIDPLVFEKLNRLEFFDLGSNDCVDESFPVEMNFEHLTELTKRNCHYLATLYFDLAFH